MANGGLWTAKGEPGTGVKLPPEATEKPKRTQDFRFPHKGIVRKAIRPVPLVLAPVGKGEPCTSVKVPSLALTEKTEILFEV